MSIHVMSLVYKARLGCPLRKAVALKLADCADDNGQSIWPAVSTIAAEAEISERSVQIKLRELVAAGLLRVADGGGGRFRTTSYEYVMPVLYALVQGHLVPGTDDEGKYALLPPSPEPEDVSPEQSADMQPEDETGSADENPAGAAPFHGQNVDKKPRRSCTVSRRNPAGGAQYPAGDSQNPAGAAPKPSLTTINHHSPPTPRGGERGRYNIVEGWISTLSEVATEAEQRVIDTLLAPLVRTRKFDAPSPEHALATLARWARAQDLDDQGLADVVERLQAERKVSVKPSDLEGAVRVAAAESARRAEIREAAERQAARDPALADRWQDAQRRLKVGLGGDVHAAWLASIEVLSADDERLVLVTERKMQAAYVARNFSQDILGAWQAAGGRAWSISISTDASVSSPAALEAHP